MQEPASAILNTSWNFLRTFEPICAMGIQHMVLPSGIELVFTNVAAADYGQLTFNIGVPPIEFSFHLSGHARATMSGPACLNNQIEARAGQAMISYNPDTRCRAQIDGCLPFRSLNIYMAPNALYALLEKDEEYIPAFLLSALENQGHGAFNFCCEISPMIRMALDQIYNCSYKGSFYTIFLETKSVELMLRLLWETSTAPKDSQTTVRPLSHADRAGIRMARDILLNEMGNPPCLKDLARQAGLNDTKLKRGFRQVFGTSVYGYLRKYRMEQATDYLASGHMSVVETAHTLGFHDTAHFIHQFKQHYGTTPGTYLKQARSPE